MSTPALGEWLNTHPNRRDPSSPLWVGEGRGGSSPLRYEAVRTLIQRLADRVGIQKSVNPHKFRHSRATFLAKRLSDAQMDQYLGWAPGSKTHSIYYHLAGRDVDGALLSIYGLAPVREERPTLKVVLCPRCNELCAPTIDHCPKCGSPTDPNRVYGLESERGWVDPAMSRLLEDTETQQFLVRKIRELRLFDEVGRALPEAVDTCQR